jgi:hypothetical protein
VRDNGREGDDWWRKFAAKRDSPRMRDERVETAECRCSIRWSCYSASFPLILQMHHVLRKEAQSNIFVLPNSIQN